MGVASSSSARGYAASEATHGSIGVPIASPVVSPRTSTRESDFVYTLVFTNTKAADPESDGQDVAGNRGRVSYADAQATVRNVTGGGREREAHVMGEFRAAWMAKFRTPAPAPHDSIPWLYFQELMRELIVQRFDSVPGLFLKTSVSEDGRSLFISFRPSNALLCATADRLQMKVAIMAEVDPGERYWSADPARTVAEAYQWSKPDAQEELYRMFLAGKISAQEAQLFDDASDREDPGMWSRRIHALRRFCDLDVAKVVAQQEASATMEMVFLPFKNRASLRYLYRQIDGQGGDDATPFRVVDKIRLTKAIIDGEFDCDALVEARLLSHHYCLHTHHTDAVDTSIDVLRAQWGALTSPWRLYLQGLAHLSQMLHYQPIAHVRNYFGEELALYFAYTSFYAQALQWLCVAAMTTALLHASAGMNPDWFYIAFAVVNTAFTQAFVRKWSVQERVLATQWGVASLRDADTARPQFRGELAVSPITHHLEMYYSPQRRQLQQLTSTALLLGVSLGLLCTDFVVLTSDMYASAVVSSPVAVHLAVTIVSKLLSGPCASLCQSLTEWENYRSQHDYDVSLTLKFSIAQSVNLFGVLWLQTFMLPFVRGVAPPREWLERAAHLLTTTLSLDLALSVWDLRGGAVETVVSMLLSRRDASTVTGDSDRSRLLTPTSSTSPSSSATLSLELALVPYEGVMFDYAQVVITFGFVAWFAALSPLATLLAWVVAVVQIRVDAFKLCVLTQRPFPTQKQSIGSWATYLQFLAFGAWLHNALLTVVYVASASPIMLLDLQDFVRFHDAPIGTDAEGERLATETLVLVALAGFWFVSFLAGIYDHRDRAQLRHLHFVRMRQYFLECKYIHNLDSVPDSVRDSLPSGQVFLNGVHLYVVTGNKAEEDAAEEILDELVQLQLRSLQLQRQIAEMRAGDAAVGTLVVEIGSINILPVMDALTKAVDSFLQLQLTRGDVDTDPSNDKPRKKDKPVNTSVIKKQRSPAWTETFELSLRSLDDELLVRVYDWELLGKNRRIGHATLRVADVVATAPPLLLAVPAAMSDTKSPNSDPPRALSVTSEASTAATAVASPVALPTSPARLPASFKVRMASFEIAIDMPGVLLSTMHADLVRHGHPKLSLRCGVQLEALGRLLLQQRHLQSKIRQLQDQEKQFFEWK